MYRQTLSLALVASAIAFPAAADHKTQTYKTYSTTSCSPCTYATTSCACGSVTAPTVTYSYSPVRTYTRTYTRIAPPSCTHYENVYRAPAQHFQTYHNVHTPQEYVYSQTGTHGTRTYSSYEYDHGYSHESAPAYYEEELAGGYGYDDDYYYDDSYYTPYSAPAYVRNDRADPWAHYGSRQR